MSRDSREIQEAVRARLDGRGVQFHVAVGAAGAAARTSGQVVDMIVWETLALLGEWDLIALVPLNDETREALG